METGHPPTPLKEAMHVRELLLVRHGESLGNVAAAAAERAGAEVVDVPARDPAELSLPVRLDVRLRDRELGVLDRLTKRGITARHPEEIQRRRWLGKFYHRPPGGESWVDVGLRVRTFLDEIDRPGAEWRLLVMCHDAVVMLFRYVCEGLTEAEVLRIAREDPVRNLSVTHLIREDDAAPWFALIHNDVSHLEHAGAPVTHHPGEPDERTP
jgi:broad specificity phosphatase PhoE